MDNAKRDSARPATEILLNLDERLEFANHNVAAYQSQLTAKKAEVENLQISVTKWRGICEYLNSLKPKEQLNDPNDIEVVDLEKKDSSKKDSSKKDSSKKPVEN